MQWTQYTNNVAEENAELQQMMTIQLEGQRKDMKHHFQQLCRSALRTSRRQRPAPHHHQSMRALVAQELPGRRQAVAAGRGHAREADRGREQGAGARGAVTWGTCCLCSPGRPPRRTSSPRCA
jgi:hypothetical protein